MSDETDDVDYQIRVTELTRKAALVLAAARGNENKLKEAIMEYLRGGYRNDMTAGELTDFFCVSAPSILEEAGFSEDEMNAAVEIFDAVHPLIRTEFDRPL